MPGPMSDAYDPEFSTQANADRIAGAIQDAVDRIGIEIGLELQYILDVIDGEPGPKHRIAFSERELRVIRFALNRALETI